MVESNWGSFEWFRDHVGLPSVGLNPRKVDFEGRESLVQECDSLWGVRQGHGGYHFMDNGPKELQERILVLWPLVYQKQWPQAKEIGLSFALGVMAERRGLPVNWALFAAVVQVSGYKAHKRAHSDFVTITSPSTSPVTTTKKAKGKSPITCTTLPETEGVSDGPLAGHSGVSEAPMQSPTPSLAIEDSVCNMRKEALAKKIDLQIRLLGDRDAFVIGLRAEMKLVQNNLSQVGYQTLQCKERLEVARAQQTACGPEADADFHIFCALEVKHALDELVSLVGEGDALQKTIDSIQERLDSECSIKKKIEHDYHAALVQYYAADQKTMKPSQPVPNVATTTSDSLTPPTTISGLSFTLTQVIYLYGLVLIFRFTSCTFVNSSDETGFCCNLLVPTPSLAFILTC